MNFLLRNLARLGAVVTLLALAAAASAQSNASLSGFVYIDRDNNGQLAFNNSANPELILSGVTIDLFQGTSTTPFATQVTDAIGRFTFSGLAAGTYRLAQTQPVGYVDGLDTLGVLTSNTGGTAPVGTSAGVVGADQFTTITLLANTVGNLYNFGERGLAPGFVSKRYLLGTAPPPIPVTPDDGEVGIDADVIVPEPAAILILAGVVILRLLSHAKHRASWVR